MPISSRPRAPGTIRALAARETIVSQPRAAAHRKLDAQVVPRATRRARAEAFQIYALIASVAFIALAVLAHTSPYFPVDLVVTRAFQSYHGPILDSLMFGVSWIGFGPQTQVICGVIFLSLYLAGLRWEAVCTAFATSGALVGALIKLLVLRPRPGADLVHVFRVLNSPSFPSGHVLEFTGLCGFLAFLSYTLLKPSWARASLLVLFGLIIVLMGPSRIYLGQHWFSDVMGAYLLGSLWLALAIKLYRWGKPRFFVHQPVAREASPAAGTS
jgi:undecaprenyl-diphosphatase